jgi:hypothetical protein
MSDNRKIKAVLNDHHLALFKFFVMRAAEYMGLERRWEMLVRWGDDNGKRAAVSYNVRARSATVELTQNTEDYWPVTVDTLLEAAMHEVAHVVIAPLSVYAEQGAERCVDVDDIEHEIVNTIVFNALRHVGQDYKELAHHLIAKAFPEPEVES